LPGSVVAPGGARVAVPGEILPVAQACPGIHGESDGGGA
jgi:hypothetical protein